MKRKNDKDFELAKPKIVEGLRIGIKDWPYEVRVMAVVDGYVMARRKGCVPFVKSVREFYNEFIKTGVSV